VEYFLAKSGDLSQASRFELLRYRHDVFIELLNWDLDLSERNTKLRLEEDQFDTDDTLNVYSKDRHGNIVGCARLLPTTLPYLLEEVFPELLGGMPTPKSDDVWELSRFACVDLGTSLADMHSQCSSELSVQLMNKTMEAAKKMGAKHLISVSPIAIERLLKKNGFEIKRLAPPQRIGGYILIACWIDL
jgi:N-acyl-L-homoserine lactone synthetase